MENDGKIILIIGVYILVLGVFTIMLIQFQMIKKFKKLFNDLSAAFTNGKNLDYITLVDRIIRSRELYKPGPSSEAVDLISQYVKGLFNESVVFLHVTEDQKIAAKILHEGFKYSDDFYKSTEEISSNLFDLTYKLQIYKHYGNFVIIICIPKEIIQHAYSSGNRTDKDAFAENGISAYNPDEELCYTLPNNFVRGYADTVNMKIVDNKYFMVDNEE